MIEELLRAENISGPGILKHVHFTAYKQEVTGLLGLNYSGKSELLRAIAGFHSPAGGRVVYGGAPVRFGSPIEARAAGIVYIDNLNALISEFSVSENIFVMQPRMGGLSVLDTYVLTEKCEGILSASGLSDIGISLDAQQKGAELSRFHKLVLILIRSVAAGARLVIVDQLLADFPQSVLPVLARLLATLTAKGATFVIADHDASTLTRVCDRITVLREGMVCGTYDREDFQEDALNSVMIGYRAGRPDGTGIRYALSGDVVLRMSGIRFLDGKGPLSLEVRRGEAVGLCTLSYSFARKLMDGLYGLSRFPRGSIQLDGRPFRPKSPRQAIARGIGLVSEWNCLFPNMSIPENVLLRRHRRNKLMPWQASWAAVAGPPAEASAARKLPHGIDAAMFTAYEAVTAMPKNSPEYQKTLGLMRCALMMPKLTLFTDLDKDVDFPTYHRLLDLVRLLTQKDQSILMTSANIQNLLPLCGRIYLVHEGRAIFDVDTAVIPYEDTIAMYGHLCSL
ncbi:MAG: ATP-binding cassette domain-containing protein [Clostridiales Family XIII bacterium]|jgi:ABC-type sugar transport system ATPase subunit|nr:ATP-binding cassette domain-containing protein [Clostridiales Family XIII bacterium]